MKEVDGAHGAEDQHCSALGSRLCSRSRSNNRNISSSIAYSIDPSTARHPPRGTPTTPGHPPSVSSLASAPQAAGDCEMSGGDPNRGRGRGRGRGRVSATSRGRGGSSMSSCLFHILKA